MITYDIDENTLVVTFTDENGGSSIFDRDTFLDRPFATLEVAKAFAEKILAMGAVNLTYPPTLEEAKTKAIEECSNVAKALLSGRPAVDTGLGFSVDGGRDDLQNFEGGKVLGLTTIRDVDNATHTITVGDWDTIITAVRTHALQIYQAKWDYEAAVNAATSIEDVESIVKPFE